MVKLLMIYPGIFQFSVAVPEVGAEGFFGEWFAIDADTLPHLYQMGRTTNTYECNNSVTTTISTKFQ